MSLLKVKTGVKVSRQVLIAAAVVNAANILGLSVDMVITSGLEGQHKPGSLHSVGKALDFRIKHLSAQDKHDLVEEARRQLGEAYQVILEAEGKPNQHVHIEWDPT